jgi:hypothetical protein
MNNRAPCKRPRPAPDRWPAQSGRGQRTVLEHRLSRRPSILHRPTHTIVRLGHDFDIATAPALPERLLGMHHAGMRLRILNPPGMSFRDAKGPAVYAEYARRVPGPYRGQA